MRQHVLVRGPRVGRSGALAGELLAPVRQHLPAGDLLLGRLDDAGPQRLGQSPVGPGKHRGEHLHQGVGRSEGGTAEHPGVQVALAGADGDVEVADAAERGAEARERLGRVPAVEDEPDVGRRRCPRRPSRRPSDRPPPPPRRSRSGRSPGARRPRARRLVASSSMKRCALSSATPRATSFPSRSTSVHGSDSQSSSGIGRLDVEMRVGEHRRRAVPGRGGDVADDERAPVPLLDLGRAAGRRDPRRDPVRGGADVTASLGVGADGRDRDQLGEIVDERVVRRDHGRDRSDGAPRRPASAPSRRAYDASNDAATELFPRPPASAPTTVSRSLLGRALPGRRAAAGRWIPDLLRGSLADGSHELRTELVRPQAS